MVKIRFKMEEKNVKYELQHTKYPLGIFVDDFKFCNVLLEGKVVRTYIQNFLYYLLFK